MVIAMVGLLAALAVTTVTHTNRVDQSHPDTSHQERRAKDIGGLEVEIITRDQQGLPQEIIVVINITQLLNMRAPGQGSLTDAQIYQKKQNETKGKRNQVATQVDLDLTLHQKTTK